MNKKEIKIGSKIKVKASWPRGKWVGEVIRQEKIQGRDFWICKFEYDNIWPYPSEALIILD